ncbi:unnamed protein product [Hymenolepis diminuta]|uniref:ARF7 effector protein C-terminal domain-containing protein n=1 Tax=Hymenolepis diminuta TaxID=6216 RepID=A0A564YPR8_HYMDI|nr:unnamed protein product [Hymenolepis diminuta]
MTEPMDSDGSSKQKSRDNNPALSSQSKWALVEYQPSDIKPNVEQLISNLFGNTPERVKKTEEHSLIKEEDLGTSNVSADDSTVQFEVKEEPMIHEVPVGSTEHPSTSTAAAASEVGLFASLQAYITDTSPSHALKSFRDNLTSAYSLDDTSSATKTSAAVRKPIGGDKRLTAATKVNVEGAVNVSSESIPMSSNYEILTDTAEVKSDYENPTEILPMEISTGAAMEFSEDTQSSPAPTDSSISTLGGGEKRKKKKQVCRKTTASSPGTNTPVPQPPSTINLPSVSAELNRLKFTNPGKMNAEISFSWNHGNVTRGFRRQHTHTLQPASANGSVNGPEIVDSTSINWTQEEGYMARGHVKQMEMHVQLCRTNSFDPPLYDSRGLILATMEDLCDCMRPACPGCFLPCRRCHKTKCGPLCRILRNFQYEQAEVYL